MTFTSAISIKNRNDDLGILTQLLHLLTYIHGFVARAFYMVRKFVIISIGLIVKNDGSAARSMRGHHVSPLTV